MSGTHRDRDAAAKVRGRRVKVTKIGLWAALGAAILGLAAANSGNNALYMMFAVLVALLAASWAASKANLRGLRLTLEPPEDVHAKTPADVAFEIAARGRPSRRELLLSVRGGPWLLVEELGRRAARGRWELVWPRRGRHRVAPVVVRSLFPLGFFRAEAALDTGREILVYPELFESADYGVRMARVHGEQENRRRGAGQDLHSLRPFRSGDDPRHIHWKQTARSGDLVFRQPTAEENRRLTVVLDNVVASQDAAAESRFEALVSEAASACVHYLDQGFEVEFLSRQDHLPHGGGRRQRIAILERLALVERVAASSAPPLAVERPQLLRFAMTDRDGGSPAVGDHGRELAS